MLDCLCVHEIERWSWYFPHVDFLPPVRLCDIRCHCYLLTRLSILLHTHSPLPTLMHILIVVPYDQGRNSRGIRRDRSTFSAADYASGIDFTLPLEICICVVQLQSSPDSLRSSSTASHTLTLPRKRSQLSLSRLDSPPPASFHHPSISTSYSTTHPLLIYLENIQHLTPNRDVPQPIPSLHTAVHTADVLGQLYA